MQHTKQVHDYKISKTISGQVLQRAGVQSTVVSSSNALQDPKILNTTLTRKCPLPPSKTLSTRLTRHPPDPSQQAKALSIGRNMGKYRYSCIPCGRPCASEVDQEEHFKSDNVEQLSLDDHQHCNVSSWSHRFIGAYPYRGFPLGAPVP